MGLNTIIFCIIIIIFPRVETIQSNILSRPSQLFDKLRYTEDRFRINKLNFIHLMNKHVFEKSFLARGRIVFNQTLTLLILDTR